MSSQPATTGRSYQIDSKAPPRAEKSIKPVASLSSETEPEPKFTPAAYAKPVPEEPKQE